MRHHAEYIEPLIRDARDAVGRSVRVAVRCKASPRITVAKQDSSALGEITDGLRIGDVTSLAVRNGYRKNLILSCLSRPGSVRVLYAQMDRLADKLQPPISDQRPRQQMRLAEDLEAVADSEHITAEIGVVADSIHYRRKAGDGPGPQIVAIREATRQDQAVVSLDASLLMPYVVHGLTQNVLDHMISVLIADGSRKADDTEFHSMTSKR